MLQDSCVMCVLAHREALVRTIAVIHHAVQMRGVPTLYLHVHVSFEFSPKPSMFPNTHSSHCNVQLFRAGWDEDVGLA